MNPPDQAREAMLRDFTKISFNFYRQKDFTSGEFEEKYVSLREKEGRLYRDTVVSKLPLFHGAGALKKEWAIRKRSAERITEYIRRTKPTSSILEVGCGNGWMSNYIATRTSAEVLGLDVNGIELAQAARVFQSCERLLFLQAEFTGIGLPSQSFDMILFPSSIQYFENVKTVLNHAVDLLRSGGEIHILDSPFYTKENLAEARDRSRQYFKSQRSELTNYYHHHSWDELQQFDFVIMPQDAPIRRLLQALLSRANPFPWIKVVKK